MIDTDAPRRPGPWDPKPEEAAPVPTTPASAARAGARPRPDQGQHPLWALASTLLLGGLIYWWTHSWIMVVAVLFGLLRSYVEIVQVISETLLPR